jgi:hypothetical protein
VIEAAWQRAQLLHPAQLLQSERKDSR